MLHRVIELGVRGLLWVALVSTPACFFDEDDDEETADKSGSTHRASRGGGGSPRRAFPDDDDDDDDSDGGVGSEDDDGRTTGRNSGRDRDDESDPITNDPAAVNPEDFGALREAADASGRLLGTSVDAALVKEDRNYARVLSKEFNAITVANVIAWDVVEEQRGVRWFDAADATVEAALAAGQKVRGSALFSPNLPSWAEALPAAELRAALEQHVIEMVGHFRGKISAWDVVHEAIDPETLQLRSGAYATLGAAGLADAFKWANQIDPDAELFYGDSGIEGPGPKADAVYALIRELAERGAPIDGVGLATHLDTSGYPGELALRANLARFAELAPNVGYSELDVTTKAADPTSDPTRRRSAQRLVYQLLAGACMSEPACRSLSLGGFTDRSTWIADDEPLILDVNYAKKPAYDGLLAGLSGRTPVLGGEELLDNPGFSEGELGWVAFGGGRLAVQSTLARDGMAAVVSERMQTFEGPAQSLQGKLGDEASLCLSAWVRVDAASAPVTAFIKHGTGNETTDRYQQLASTIARSDAWVELNGCGSVYVDSSETETVLYVAGAPAGVSIYLDDTSLRALLPR